MDINIEVKDDALQAVFRRMQDGLQKTRPLMREIAGLLAAETEANFAAQGRPAWAALRPQTIKRRTKKGTWPGKILQVRGQLAASVTTRYGVDFAQIGSNKAYAAIHQFGGTIDRAAYSKQIRHRTDAKGELLRSRFLHGKGLIFAKDSHRRVKVRWAEVVAHAITIKARPYLPIDGQGALQPQASAGVNGIAERYLRALSDVRITLPK